MTDWLWEHITTTRDRSWKWFETRAHSPHALVWLAFIAFTDAIISPIVPEAFIAALCLAKPGFWKRYAIVGTIFSLLGSIVGYFVAVFLFRQFGEPLLSLYGLNGAFLQAQTFIMGQVFLAMMLASFTPVPDKVFIYAGGFLGVNLVPFLVGYGIGRGARMGIVAYLTSRYGEHIVRAINKYFFYVAVAVLALFAYYSIVHFHLFGL